MDNFTLMLVGAGLTAAAAVTFRGSTILGVRAVSAAAFAPGTIMVFVTFVNALSGTG